MRAFLVALALATMPLAVGSAAPDSLVYARLESYLEALRVQAGIPGLSAAIVGDTDIVWERGFGRQDLDRASRYLPDTPFHLDGLGQTLTATLVLQCVEQGKVSLDDPVGNYDSGQRGPGRDHSSVAGAHVGRAGRRDVQLPAGTAGIAARRGSPVHGRLVPGDAGQPARSPGNEGLGARPGRRHAGAPVRGHPGRGDLGALLGSAGASDDLVPRVSTGAGEPIPALGHDRHHGQRRRLDRPRSRAVRRRAQAGSAAHA